VLPDGGPASVKFVGTSDTLTIPFTYNLTWHKVTANPASMGDRGQPIGPITSIVLQTDEGEFDSMSIFVQVQNDQPPVASGDLVTTLPDTPVDISVHDLGEDPDADPLTISKVTPPSHGTAQTDGRTITYTPDANFHGTDSFIYTLDDRRGGTSSNDVGVTVDTPPVARLARYDLTHGSSGKLTVPATSDSTLLAFASDADPGDQLSIVPVADEPTAYGAHATINADGSFTYTPGANLPGPPGDTFKYQVTDGLLTGDPGTVQILIADQAPSTSDQSFSFDHVPAGHPVFVPLGGTVIGPLRASDPDGDRLTFLKVSDPLHGLLTLNPDGTFIYDPGAIDDTFQFRVSDGTLVSDVATVHLQLADTPPIALDDNYGTPDTASQQPIQPLGSGLAYHGFDTSFVGSGTSLANSYGPYSVLSNDSDPEQDPFGIDPVNGVVQPPALGTLDLRLDGTFVYRFLGDRVHHLNFQGTVEDEFSYAASDGEATSSPAKVRLLFTPQPLAVDDPLILDTHAPQTLDPLRLLDNDLDWQGNPILDSHEPYWVALTGYDANGLSFAGVDPDGQLLIQARAGFVGRTTLTYTVSQPDPGQPGKVITSLPATVFIDVTRGSDIPPPVGQPDDYSVVQGHSILPGTVPSVLANDFALGSPLPARCS
jgi:hypothetical protein